MKKILSLLIVSIMILSSFVSLADTVESAGFTDVDPQTDVGKAILKLKDAGIVNGNGDGTFAPERNVTRAELCKMINNIKNYTEEDETVFSDVTSDKWYYSHVKIAKKAGYINGFEDGTFRGEQYVTREQVCAILVRVLGLYDLGLPVTISDPISPWAESYVKTVVANTLIKTEAGDTFRATEDMTRAELALPLSSFIIDPSDDIIVPEIKDEKDDNKEDNKVTGGSGISSGNNSSGNKNDKDDTSDEGEEGIPDEGEEGIPDEGDEGTPDEGGAVEEEFDEKLQNEVVDKLNALIQQLDEIAELPWIELTETEKVIIASIKETVGKTLKDAEAGKRIYVEDYVVNTYNSDVMSVRSMYDNLTEEEKEAFKTKLGELSLNLLEYLADTMFGIDIKQHI